MFKPRRGPLCMVKYDIIERSLLRSEKFLRYALIPVQVFSSVWVLGLEWIANVVIASNRECWGHSESGTHVLTSQEVGVLAFRKAVRSPNNIRLRTM